METIGNNGANDSEEINFWEEAMAETRKRMEIHQKATEKIDAIYKDPDLSQVEKDLAMIDMVPTSEETPHPESNTQNTSQPNTGSSYATDFVEQVWSEDERKKRENEFAIEEAERKFGKLSTPDDPNASQTRTPRQNCLIYDIIKQ